VEGSEVATTTSRSKTKAAGKKPRLKRNSLNRDEIIDAAVKLTAEVGLDNFSMRLLSDRLGGTPMAIYRHVRDKDELSSLVADAVMARVHIPEANSGTWRERLRSLVLSAREVYADYPGVAAYNLSHPAGPSRHRIEKCTYEILESAGFKDREAKLATGFVASFVRGRLYIENALPGNTEHPMFDNITAQEHFEYGLECVFDVLELRLRAQKRAAGGKNTAVKQLATR
jgi:AcrR family transcriptional regulator